MSGLKPRIVFWPAAILKQPCKEVEDFDEGLQNLVKQMKSVMNGAGGIGLTANQIGVDLKVVLIAPQEDKVPEVFINPSIEETRGEPVETIEGCLSLPGVVAKLKIRYPSVTVSAYGVDGRPFQMVLTKRDAVALQHEISHTQGLTMFDYMKGIKKRMAQNKCRKAIKKVERR